MFGNKIQKNLENTNIFMVGTGTLGCWFFKKTFSLAGISSDEKHIDKYTINVTDNDNIVESNLNRQFLLRKENIGEQQSKITC